MGVRLDSHWSLIRPHTTHYHYTHFYTHGPKQGATLMSFHRSSASDGGFVGKGKRYGCHAATMAFNYFAN